MNLHILALLIALAIVSIIATSVLYYRSFPAQQSPACDSYSYSDCPSQCVVCPPCEVCSSIACRSEEFCAGIGFDRSWYEQVSHPAG